MRHPGLASAATVADELAVRRVLAANQLAICDGDEAAYLATYHENAHVVFWNREVTGHAGLAAHFRESQAAITVRDTIVGLRVEIYGATATAVGSGFVVPAARVPAHLLATTRVHTDLGRGPDGSWRIRSQVKMADPNFDPAVGTVAELLERLARRVDALERAMPESAPPKEASADVAVVTTDLT